MGYICVRKYRCGCFPACPGDCLSLYAIPSGMELPGALNERMGCKPCFYEHDGRRLTRSMAADLEQQLIYNREEIAICFNPAETLHQRRIRMAR